MKPLKRSPQTPPPIPLPPYQQFLAFLEGDISALGEMSDHLTRCPANVHDLPHHCVHGHYLFLLHLNPGYFVSSLPDNHWCMCHISLKQFLSKTPIKKEMVIRVLVFGLLLHTATTIPGHISCQFSTRSESLPTFCNSMT